jgi:hypothetical protein
MAAKRQANIEGTVKLRKKVIKYRRMRSIRERIDNSNQIEDPRGIKIIEPTNFSRQSRKNL